MNDVRIESLGDRSLLLCFGDRIDADLNLRVHAAARALRSANLPGVLDIVPAYASIAVHYEPSAWSNAESAAPPGERIAAQLLQIAVARPVAAAAGASGETERVVEIPIRYGGEHGPDLADVARLAGLSEDEVIARHARGEYRVAMLGFAPGFPYLLVPAGSVAIGGAQTGIYPRELPGGWQIIGRTPLALFAAERDPPALLAPGQRVRFVRIYA
jgi:KipI family sensor histidine kinase inhibitor